MPESGPHPAKKRHCLQKVARKEQVGALNAIVALPKVQLVARKAQLLVRNDQLEAPNDQLRARKDQLLVRSLHLVVPNEQRWGNGFAEGPGRERLNILLAEVERIAAVQLLGVGNGVALAPVVL